MKPTFCEYCGENLIRRNEKVEEMYFRPFKKVSNKTPEYETTYEKLNWFYRLIGKQPKKINKLVGYSVKTDYEWAVNKERRPDYISYEIVCPNYKNKRLGDKTDNINHHYQFEMEPKGKAKIENGEVVG